MSVLCSLILYIQYQSIEQVWSVVEKKIQILVVQSTNLETIVWCHDNSMDPNLEILLPEHRRIHNKNI